MQIRGHGKLHLNFLADSGKYSHITEVGNDVYVPSSLFNIIPPQILIANFNTKYNLYMDYEKNDDTEYIISFENKHLSQHGLRISSEILRYFPCSGSPVRFRDSESLRTFGRGDYKVFRPKRRSEFSRYCVMVS